MADKKAIKPVALAVGAALAGSFAISGTVNAADTAVSPFSISSLEVGYMLGEGEGRCGGDAKEEKAKGEGACGEKGAEGACGEKGAEGACGEAGTEGAEGDAEDKEGEGKCGEGSCGGSV